jgi:TetR/AcrR family transcriptional regulator, transcriptional repressor of aconitase
MDTAERARTITDAARACFLQFGYAKTSMDDIARRAGISRPLVYRAFKNKEAIFRTVYEDTFAHRFPEALAVAGSRMARRRKILRVCELLLIEPWSELHRSPMLAEYYSTCRQLVPEAECRHQRLKLDIAQTILGDRERADLFLMAAQGLMLDLPTPATLRKRVTLLIDRFL